MKALEAKMPNLRVNLICLSVCYIAIGTVLLFFPELSIDTISTVLGIISIIFGIIGIAVYFIRRGYLSENQVGFSLGAAALLFGVYAVVRNVEFAGIFVQVLGVLVIADSILKLQFSMDLLRFGAKRWWILLLVALATAGLGLAILLNPFPDAAARLLYTYIVLIVDGVINIASMILLNIQAKKYAALQTVED